jgi:competence protein ComEA
LKQDKQTIFIVTLYSILLICISFSLGFFIDFNNKNPPYNQQTQIINISDNREQQEKNENLINLNTATKEELESLPGIGEKIADDILEYRHINNFTSIYDLKKIKYIGEEKFNNLKKLVVVK